MSVPISGVPDSNFKPSLTIIDQTTHEPFAVVGDSNLGVAFIQIVDNANNPLGTATHPLYTQLIVEPTINIGEVELTDGTNTANVLKSDGTAAGQNAALVGVAYQSQSFTALAAGPGTVYDVGGYRSLSIQVTQLYTGQISMNFQFSNDNVNWVNASVVQIGTANTESTSPNAIGIYETSLRARYFRLNFNGTQTAGSTLGTLLFSTIPSTGRGMGVLAVQNGTWNVGANSATGSAVPANAFYIGMSSGGNLVGLKGVADAADNTSSNQLAVGPYYYNGGGFDRQRGNFNTATGDTPTIVTATTTNGATQTNYNARGAIVTAILGTVTGTAPTLALQLQYSPDGGTTWINYGAPTSAISIATGNTVAILIYDGIDTTSTLGNTGSKVLNLRLPRTWRMNYITAGTGTLSIPIASCQVNYLL